MTSNNMKVEEINNGFSTKLKVLVLDDNPGILETLLRQCQYQVTIACSSTTTDFLLQNKKNFDLAIINVDIPNMDGFMLLQYVGFEMNLPAIMLSSNSDKEFITKGITLGAWDYLIQPVRIEELDKIWQHVTRRNNNLKRKFSEKCQSEELKSADNYNKSNKKRKENDKDYEEKPGQSEISTANNKKNRLVWTPELRNKFVDVINELGVENAVPKKILEMMNDNRLTRENVASHLQKYRLSVKKSSDGKTTHEPNMGYRSSYQPTSSPGIIQRYISLDHGPITTVDSINGLDHHTLIHENGVFANWSSNAPDHSLTQDFSSGLSSLNHEGWPRGAIQPIRYCHADDIDCNDNNTPTSHYPNNQTFFHGNNVGVPQHDQEDGVHQFLQGFYFPQNDQVFNYVNNSENGV